MPNAEEPSSLKQKTFASVFSIMLALIILLLFIAFVGPKFAAYRMKSKIAAEKGKQQQMEETRR